RTRSSALGASVRLGVRDAFCWGRFPLVRPLPSIPSATGCPALFGDFAGTTGLSDFPCSFIIGVRPWTSRCAPRHIPSGVNAGSPGSRARCLRTCTGSVTARDSVAPRDIGAPDGAFRFLLQRRRPGVSFLRGCIPGPHVPLSTLRRRPRERLRMTQGRCGSLLHIRMTLSFTTPRRFNRSTGDLIMTTETQKSGIKLDKERSKFRRLILENPNYFGNLEKSSLKAVKQLTGNTQYEELTCVGFNPQTNFLEAT